MVPMYLYTTLFFSYTEDSSLLCDECNEKGPDPFHFFSETLTSFPNVSKNTGSKRKRK